MSETQPNPGGAGAPPAPGLAAPPPVFHKDVGSAAALPAAPAAPAPAEHAKSQPSRGAQLRPDLVGFAALFPEGLPAQSHILLYGPPGSGKTPFALSVVRDLMQQDPHSKLYFISTELSYARLGRDFGNFGWFTAKPRDRIFRTSSEKTKGSRPRSRVEVPEIPEFGTFHRPSGSGPLVDLVTSTVREAARADEDLKELKNCRLYVIVDSLTALLKDSRDPGEHRRQAYQFITSLRGQNTFPRAPDLVLLLSQHRSAVAGGLEIPPEEYIVDSVVQLSVKDTGAGRRLRTLEVTKSHGTTTLLGEHTFSIVSKDSLKGVIAQKRLRHLIEDVVGVTAQTDNTLNSKEAWATTIICTRPRLPPIADENEPQATRAVAQEVGPAGSAKVSTGTPGLDAMFAGDVRSGADAQAELTRPRPAIHRGSSTLLMGPSGAGKTILGLQFLLAEEDPARALYVNFENPPRRVIDAFPASDALKGKLRACNFLYRRRSNLDVNMFLCELLVAVAGRAKKGKLTYKDYPIGPRVERVVIDGLSDLVAEMTEKEYAQLLEGLVETLREANPNVSALISYEMPADRTTFAPPLKGLSVASDNIIVLRQLSVSDTLRKTIHILKARNLHPDRQVREVVVRKPTSEDALPLVIRPGLEEYRNLLNGRPQPLEVTLHLFGENKAEDAFNTAVAKGLGDRFWFKVKTRRFTRGEMTRTLQESLSPDGSPLEPDIQLLSLDEWWIREYAAAASGGETPLLDLTRFIGRGPGAGGTGGTSRYGTDFWAFEIEKGTHVVGEPPPAHPPGAPGDPPKQAPGPRLFAVPNYQDFGLFCVNRETWQECFLGACDAAAGPPDARALLAEVPRVWTDYDADGGFAEPAAGKPATVVDLLHQAKVAYETASRGKGGRGRPFVGFAFDLETKEVAVCAYLELCWAFGAAEDFLTRDVASGVLARETDADARKRFYETCPATRALRLLQFLAKKGLMPRRPTLRDCGHALLSRHFFSTMCQETEQCRHDGSGKRLPRGEPCLVPLPFFPVGLSPAESGGQAMPPRVRALVEATLDACERLERLVQRVYVAALLRRADEQTLADLEKCRVDLPEVAKLDSEASVRHAVKKLRDVGTRLKGLGGSKWFRLPSATPCAAHAGGDEPPKLERQWTPLLATADSIDRRDVEELLRWHNFRLNLILAELDHRPLADVWSTHPTDDAEVDPPEGKSAPLEMGTAGAGGGFVGALTGYACSGSWMLGVLRTARNPGTAWKMIEEVTSLESAVKRMELSAGIPARSDFFEFYGDEPLKLAPHLTWNQLLLSAGSRARRRDRLCGNLRLTVVADLIHGHLLECLAAPERTELPAEAVESIYTLVREQMGSVCPALNPANNNGACLTCPAWKQKNG